MLRKKLNANIKFKFIKLPLISFLSLTIIFSCAASAFANPLLWPLVPVKAFFDGAGFVASKIVSSISSGQAARTFTQPGSDGLTDEQIKKILSLEPLSLEVIDPVELKNIIDSKLPASPVSSRANKISAEIQLLTKKLAVLEKLYDESFVDVAETLSQSGVNASGGMPSGAPPSNATLNRVIETAPLPAFEIPAPGSKNNGRANSLQTGGGGQQQDLISKLKDSDPNSTQFKSIFEKFKEELKPETKSYLTYATSSDMSKKILPPDFEMKANSGIKLWQDKYDDQKLANRSWSFGEAPQSGADAIAKAYTSNYLNIKDDPSLSQNVLAKTRNSEFPEVKLNQGTTKFGWTHIAYDRPDGTCHAREIKEAFGLKDQDGAVRDFILETIKTGKAEEQVRERNGQPQHRMLYTRTVNGQEIKVVVDNDDKYRGSVITAYPTGKVKAPTPDEIQKRIEEEKKKLAEAAKKNQPWRNPSISVDFYRNEIGKTIGPQIKAGTESKFRLGGATLSTGAKGDILLIGAEAKGASYVGIRNGQLAAGLQGSVFAGSRARGEVYTGIRVGQVGGRAFAGGEVSAGAGANADASVGAGKEGLSASLSGDAFVGVRAKGQIGGTISHGNTSVTAAVNGTVGAGLGAHFEAKGKISWSGINAKVNLGAYLGIGGQVGFDVNVNFGDTLKPVQKVVEKVYDRGKQVAAKIGNDIKNDIDKGKKALAKLFKW